MKTKLFTLVDAIAKCVELEGGRIFTGDVLALTVRQEPDGYEAEATFKLNWNARVYSICPIAQDNFGWDEALKYLLRSECVWTKVDGHSQKILPMFQYLPYFQFEGTGECNIHVDELKIKRFTVTEDRS